MGDANGTEAGGNSFPVGSIAKLTREILDSTIHNIIHDIVADVHRKEKIARMRSAVVLARQKGEEEVARLREKTGGQASGTSAPSFANVRVETEGAIFDEGKVYLKGNPLQTTKDIICPDCRLPRLLYPIYGTGARLPADRERGYCGDHPLINHPGLDVYGNKFAVDNPVKKKKAKVEGKKTPVEGKQNATEETPAGSPPQSPEPEPSLQHEPIQLVFTSVKCPNCVRYNSANKTASHLERCMQLNVRQARRTPMDSGASTPNAAPRKRSLADEDLPLASTKKKKPNNTKKQSGKKPPVSSKLKNGTTPDMAAAEDADIKSETNGDN